MQSNATQSNNAKQSKTLHSIAKQSNAKQGKVMQN
jgi:hypothetical protein